MFDVLLEWDDHACVKKVQKARNLATSGHLLDDIINLLRSQF